jgi:protein involved in polysaccharide export with SLBB domain
MTPRSKKPKKPSSTSVDVVESIRLTDLYFLKYSARANYVTIDPKIVRAYGLLPGDVLKITIVEARKHRELLEAPGGDD